MIWKSDYFKDIDEGDLSGLAVVVPAYNEEKTIDTLISELISLGVKYIIVVNDCSKDKTLEKLSSFDPFRVRVISLKRNRGKEGALKIGFKYVADNLPVSKVVTLDGDLQHDPYLLCKFSRLLDDYDIVIGSRGRDDMPSSRKFSNNVVQAIFRKVGKLDLKDIQSGYRAYRINAIKKLGKVLSGKNRFLVDHNIIYHILPARIAELRIPTIYHHIRESHISKLDVLKLFFGSFKVAWLIRKKLNKLF